jgi:hypothetical protein
MRHGQAPTSHTVEGRQIAELNAHLRAAPAVADRLARTPGSTPRALPPGATLVHLWMEGSPDFGYVYGTFRVPGGRTVDVPVHTPTLRALSRGYDLRHVWGCPAVT